MRAYTTRIKVRYAETDQMGVVHHASFYPWYEVARTDFLEDVVASYKEIEEMGLMLPVVNSHCEHKKPAKYGDEVCITSTLKEINRVKMVVAYEIHVFDELIATGYTTHAFVGKDFKVVNLKKQFPKIYDRLKSCID